MNTVGSTDLLNLSPQPKSAEMSKSVQKTSAEASKPSPFKETLAQAQSHSEPQKNQMSRNSSPNYSEKSSRNTDPVGQKPVPDDEKSRQQVEAYEKKQLLKDKTSSDSLVTPGQINRSSTPGPEFVDPLNRRIAIQKFIKDMKSQLDIDASEIVESLNSLNAQELALPPELNMERVIQNLNLNPQDQQVARGLFENMLKHSASETMADYLKSNNRQLSLEVMSQRELSERKLDRGLNQMNSQFFVDNMQKRNATVQQQVPIQPNQNNQGKVDISQFQMMNEAEELSQLSMGEKFFNQGTQKTMASKPQGQMGAMMAPALSTAGKMGVNGPAQVMQTPVAPMSDPNLMPDYGMENVQMSSPKQGMDLLSEEGLRSLDVQLPKSLNTQSSQVYQQSAAPEASVESAAAGMNLYKDSSDQSQGEEGEGDFFLKQESVSGQNQTENKNEKSVKFSNLVADGKASEADESSNARKLVQNAQLLIKKGGGEMKMKLAPEGLGEVTLKVAQSGENVNVEMITTSQEAKRILEKGLGDLKSTLASHKLNVEGVKVDFDSEISKHLDRQQDEAQRQFAHQFLEDFRRNNNAFRSAMVDLPGIKTGNSQTEDEAGNEYQTPGNYNQNRSNKRLDLVA